MFLVGSYLLGFSFNPALQMFPLIGVFRLFMFNVVILLHINLSFYFIFLIVCFCSLFPFFEPVFGLSIFYDSILSPLLTYSLFVIICFRAYTIYIFHYDSLPSCDKLLHIREYIVSTFIVFLWPSSNCYVLYICYKPILHG